MDGHIPYITFTSLLIVAYPLIVPSPPRLTAVVALLAAATAPVGILLLRVLGQVPPEAADYLRASFMPAVSATIAVFGSAVIYEVNAEVAKARELGSYQLQSLLGRGGMGEVWTAKHRLLARPAAIKLVRPELVAGDPESQELLLKRFEREAQTTASLRSPHTIELYDFGIAGDGTFYYVMELLRGFDVDKLVDRWGPMLPERAIHLIRQVCESLGEAHEQGLIHRDVKPANLYVCRYGREFDFVKVLDFGLVKPRGERGDDDPKLTGDNIVGGTPGFIAPEQVLGDRPVDGRTDIYSLGCVSYWMLTGTMVFRGKTPMETMVHHVKTEPVPPSQRTEVEIPRSLENVILACLEKEPEHRPANTDALSDLLAACVDEVPPWTRERARQWWEAHEPDRL